MKSQIAKALKLQSQPVAVYRSAGCPKNALQFKPGKWGCVISMLAAAAKGRTAAFCKETVVCGGGKSGLGLEKFQPGTIEYFLSVGGHGAKAAEHYKQTPELALDYINSLPDVTTEDYLIFQPLSEVTDNTPEIIIFLVNANQLSGLVTLANYDLPTQNNVQINFGAGCAQAVLYGLDAAKNQPDTCFIGLTDPSARKVIDKDMLSFTIPYNRFLTMEENTAESFFSTDTWEVIQKRL